MQALLNTIWMQIILALVIGACYGVVFGVPKRALITSGIAGAIGWLGYIAIMKWNGNIVAASLVGGICVALIAELAAHVQKFPVTIVAVPGIVLLVPGGMAYDAMKALISGDYVNGFGMFIKTLLMAGAITIGLFLTGAWMNMTKSSLGKGADAQSDCEEDY